MAPSKYEEMARRIKLRATRPDYIRFVETFRLHGFEPHPQEVGVEWEDVSRTQLFRQLMPFRIAPKVYFIRLSSTGRYAVELSINDEYFVKHLGYDGRVAAGWFNDFTFEFDGWNAPKSSPGQFDILSNLIKSVLGDPKSA